MGLFQVSRFGFRDLKFGVRVFEVVGSQDMGLRVGGLFSESFRERGTLRSCINLRASAC